jgi:NhaP-type Na+/H+ or K+/H+ antiporter
LFPPHRIQKAFTELLTFGALISATDPVTTLAVFQVKRVDPHLFYLVFGESVLNDAVGLVLFNAFKDFVARDNGAGKVVIGVGEFMLGFVLDSVASPVLGLLCGCGAALLFKKMDMRSTPLLELSVYVLIVFVPFLLAEICLLSGIVTILFTGMAARAYVVPNLSDATAEKAETLFRLLAHLAETSIFLELGLSVFGLRGNFKVKFILWAIVACLIGRALNVYPITFLYNKRLQTEPQGETELAECQKRHSQHNKGSTSESHLEMVENLHSADHHQNQPEGKHIPMIVRQESNLSVNTLGTLTPVVRRDLKISWRTAHMLCFSGLRGAVAYACVRSFPDTFGHRREFVVTTMCIILVTVFALGSTTGAMLNLLQIDMGVDEDRYMESWHQARRSATLILRFEEFIYRHVVRDATSTVPSAHVVESADVKYSTSPSSPAESSSPTHYNDVETPESFQTTDELGQSRHNLRKKGSLFDYGFER